MTMGWPGRNEARRIVAQLMDYWRRQLATIG